ncbi:MAG: 6,7-dimethyl-8-ribityllumazine synthase [Pirellulaceae bacterium]|nr:MAG: 6,7-dimethyl-8-ribityllumazine synthase [Pirellulaceae bacterium]
MAQVWEGQLCWVPETRLAIVVSRYHEHITRRLLDGAVGTLKQAGVPEQWIDIAWVPGSWELPAAAAALAFSRRYAAVLCLGAVIRGETTHDQYINMQVSSSLGQIAWQARVPVLFGVLTCQSLEQALQRAGGTAGNKGSECAEAALRMVDLFAQWRQAGILAPPSPQP